MLGVDVMPESFKVLTSAPPIIVDLRDEDEALSPLEQRLLVLGEEMRERMESLKMSLKHACFIRR